MDKESWQRRRRNEWEAQRLNRPIRTQARDDYIYNLMTREECRLYNLTPPRDLKPLPYFKPKVYRKTTSTGEWEWRSDTDSDGPQLEKYSLLIQYKKEDAARAAEAKAAEESSSAQPQAAQAEVAQAEAAPQASTSGVGAGARPKEASSPKDVIVISSDTSSDEEEVVQPRPHRRVHSVMPKGWRNRKMPRPPPRK